jgi:hypothetical protein
MVVYYTEYIVYQIYPDIYDSKYIAYQIYSNSTSKKETVKVMV